MNPYLTWYSCALFAQLIIISSTHPVSVRIKTVVGTQLTIGKKSVLAQILMHPLFPHTSNWSMGLTTCCDRHNNRDAYPTGEQVSICLPVAHIRLVNAENQAS